jgi:hypothetical protein
VQVAVEALPVQAGGGLLLQLVVEAGQRGDVEVRPLANCCNDCAPRGSPRTPSFIRDDRRALCARITTYLLL